jgi:hypothetical protein
MTPSSTQIATFEASMAGTKLFDFISSRVSCPWVDYLCSVVDCYAFITSSTLPIEAPPNQSFNTQDEAIQFVRDWGRDHGFGVAIKRMYN